MLDEWVCVNDAHLEHDGVNYLRKGTLWNMGNK